jgi:integrase
MTQTSIHQAYDQNGCRKYLTVNEGKSFLRVATLLPVRERLLCEALYFTGCRISEAVALTIDDLDEAASLVRILCLKKRRKILVRRVPIPPSLMAGLLALGADSGVKLWPFSRMTAWRIVKEVMAGAGLAGIHATCKGLRHGFGVRAALAGLPVTLIQRWMGHASASTTAIYLDVKDDEERELIARTWK